MLVVTRNMSPLATMTPSLYQSHSCTGGRALASHRISSLRPSVSLVTSPSSLSVT